MIFKDFKYGLAMSCCDGYFTEAFAYWCRHRPNNTTDPCPRQSCKFSDKYIGIQNTIMIRSGTFIFLEDEEEL